MAQQQQQVRVIPLAPKPLCSPHLYETAYQVEVQLDEPLWSPRTGPQAVAVEMMALCVQLESIIVSCALSETEEPGISKRVSFERAIKSKAGAVTGQMKELLRRAGEDDDLECYMRNTGLSYLFPRVEMYLQEPEQELSKIHNPVMEGYFAHLTSLNSLVTMAQQLNSDVQECASHKYIAHQTVLLHQCVSHLGAPFSHYKKEIEGKFTAIKAACTPPGSGHPPRLSTDLQLWLMGTSERLVREVVSLQPQLISPLSHVLTTILDIS